MSNHEDRAMDETLDDLDFLNGQGAHDAEAVRIVEAVLGPIGYGSLDLSDPTEVVAAYRHRQRAMELICHEADLVNLTGVGEMGTIDRDARTVLETVIFERWRVLWTLDFGPNRPWASSVALYLAGNLPMPVDISGFENTFLMVSTTEYEFVASLRRAELEVC